MLLGILPGVCRSKWINCDGSEPEIGIILCRVCMLNVNVRASLPALGVFLGHVRGATVSLNHQQAIVMATTMGAVCVCA